jgi:hypothetical protein
LLPLSQQLLGELAILFCHDITGRYALCMRFQKTFQTSINALVLGRVIKYLLTLSRQP